MTTSLALPIDPVDALRIALDRRFFRSGARLALPAPTSSPARVAFLRLEELVELEPERLRERLINLTATLHSARLGLTPWIRSDGRDIEIYYGVSEHDESPTAQHHPDRQQLLRQALQGNLHGLRLIPIKDEGVAGETHPNVRLHAARRDAGAVIVGLPSERVDTPVETRLDETLLGLHGVSFDLIVECKPVDEGALDLAESNIGQVVEMAHGLGRVQWSESESTAFQRSYTEGYSRSLSASDTVSLASSMGEQRQRRGPGAEAATGAVLGAAAGALVGFVAAGVGAPGAGAAAGALVGRVIGWGVARTASPVHETTTTSESRSHQTGVSDTETHSGGLSSTEQQGIQRSLEQLNRRAVELENLAEAHLQRIRRARATGARRHYGLA